jgi:circadian clock protein KaiC
MGLHFIFQEPAPGNRAFTRLFRRLRIRSPESPPALVVDRRARSQHLSRSLVDMYIDQWVYELLDLIRKTGAKRMVIDSLIDLMVTAAIRFAVSGYSLVQRCADAESA